MKILRAIAAAAVSAAVFGSGLTVSAHGDCITSFSIV